MILKHFLHILDDNKLRPISLSVTKLEWSISKVYNYFSRSPNRQTKLKNWQRCLEQPKVRFKRLFDIRWSCIRDSIKPIIENIQPSNPNQFCLQWDIYHGRFSFRLSSVVYCT